MLYVRVWLGVVYFLSFFLRNFKEAKMVTIERVVKSTYVWYCTFSSQRGRISSQNKDFIQVLWLFEMNSDDFICGEMAYYFISIFKIFRLAKISSK